MRDRRLLESCLKAYLKALEEEKRLQKGSLNSYRIELELLLRLLEENGAQEAALKEHLSSKSPATHRRKLLIWKGFLKSCPEPYSQLLTQTKQPKLRQKQPQFLTEDEAFRLENACFKSKQKNRNRMFIALGLQLGLRLSEILNLRFEDFEADGWLRLIRKGGKEQRLPLSPSLVIAARDWKAELRAKDTDYVFPGNSGNKMSSRNAQKTLDQLAKLAGIQKKIHPHSLRHSFATKLAAKGVSLASLKEILGHASITTTEKYLHVTPEHLRQALGSDPRAR